ncbi:MAG: hypothetical protein QW587_04885 [Candidatus Bathyarchaeia archaeon]
MEPVDLIVSLVYALKSGVPNRTQRRVTVEDFFAALNRRGVLTNVETEVYTQVALREV